jgi:hypothetical protein
LGFPLLKTNFVFLCFLSGLELIIGAHDRD